MILDPSDTALTPRPSSSCHKNMVVAQDTAEREYENQVRDFSKCDTEKSEFTLRLVDLRILIGMN